MLNNTIGLPSYSAPFKALELINNTAGGYGDNIATSPYNIVPVGDRASLSLTPMISFVNVSMMLKDSFGQILKGTPNIPIAYILEAWTCSTADCTIQTSLSPLTFLTFDPESGIADSATLKLSSPCVENHSTVIIYFTVYGSTSSLLTASFTLQCFGCGTHEFRVKDVSSSGVRAWYCKPCLAGQYIINPNYDSCQDCPSGKQL